ncbi:MAG TPA: hypothetical protein DCP74_08210 [Bacteroidales bacterium]|nr:hypothetical protein [Bacteroidales bacterium]
MPYPRASRGSDEFIFRAQVNKKICYKGVFRIFVRNIRKFPDIIIGQDLNFPSVWLHSIKVLLHTPIHGDDDRVRVKRGGLPGKKIERRFRPAVLADPQQN